jgi:hypothetical protein
MAYKDSTEYGFGQMGSIHVRGTTAVTAYIAGSADDTPASNVTKVEPVFVAITFLEDTTFNTGASGLIPESAQLYPSSDGASTDIDADGGVAVDSETFPKGVTIYGRWTGFQLATGGVIAYLGY